MKWIKCTDKMPTLAQEVLVCQIDTNRIYCAVYIPQKYDNGECLFYDNYLNSKIWDITHWMTLPEMPLDANKE
jgi:hypothetical protein